MQTTYTTKTREGEAGIAPPRSDRFYLLENDWFFTTREGASVGPFDTRDSAETGLKDFLDFLVLAAPKTRRAFLASMEA